MFSFQNWKRRVLLLVKRKQPIIIVLARSLYKKIPVTFKPLLEENRLLIISPFENNVKRVTRQTAYERNKFIIEISDELFIPYVYPNGQLDKLIKKMNVDFRTIWFYRLLINLISCRDILRFIMLSDFNFPNDRHYTIKIWRFIRFLQIASKLRYTIGNKQIC